MLSINEIYCGDNIDLIKQLEDNCIDTIITSPPYGNILGKHYNHVYDFVSLAKEMYRVLKPGGWLCWNEKDQHKKGELTYNTHSHLYEFKKINLKHFDTIIQISSHKFFNPNYYLVNSYEFIFCLYKEKRKDINFLKKINKYGNITHKLKRTSKEISISYVDNEKTITYKEYRRDSNVWHQTHTSDIIRTNHLGIVNKGKMNLGICRRLVYTFSNPNDLILDPFNGIGTTCIVSKEMGRNYIGFELESKYVNFTKEYLQNVKNITYKGIIDNNNKLI